MIVVFEIVHESEEFRNEGESGIIWRELSGFPSPSKLVGREPEKKEAITTREVRRARAPEDIDGGHQARERRSAAQVRRSGRRLLSRADRNRSLSNVDWESSVLGRDK